VARIHQPGHYLQPVPLNYARRSFSPSRGRLKWFRHLNDPAQIEQTALEPNEVIKARVLLEDIKLKV